MIAELRDSTELIAKRLLLEAEALLEAREIAKAIALLEAAESLGADADRCAAGRWHCHMLAGDFAAAWRESDAIRFRGAEDPHRFWDGSSIDGKRIIVRCLHGFGDAIQFLRYAPYLRRRAERVTVEVSPRLVELVRLLPGIDSVVSWEKSAAVDWDMQIEVMELPYLFRSTLDDLPRTPRYLNLPAKLIEHIGAKMRPRRQPRLGVVWAAGGWNCSRSIPFEMLLPLLSLDSFEFWSLQGGNEDTPWKDVAAEYDLKDSAELGPGLMTLAGVIANLDLVISVDTMAAHLAASMGVTTFLLLQRAADWRWMTERDDTPWYPSMRLFRQDADGGWPELIHRVRRTLLQGDCFRAAPDLLEMR